MDVGRDKLGCLNLEHPLSGLTPADDGEEEQEAQGTDRGNCPHVVTLSRWIETLTPHISPL